MEANNAMASSHLLICENRFGIGGMKDRKAGAVKSAREDSW